MKIDTTVTANSLKAKTEQMFDLSAKKINMINQAWNPNDGTPVFTWQGRYTTRGWTEWTQGFQYGSEILQFDATGEHDFLEMGRKNTVALMAPHVTHVGVHDHGFNNVSTYGNLRRLMLEAKIPHNEWELSFYEMAIKASGAVQAARWTNTENGLGYIYSFNGPHSLFVDTIRSLRAVGLSHKLGHVLMGENDQPISLLGRLFDHARNTARFNVYYGEGRDNYDIPGRALHEAVFNEHTGVFRCPSTQQGYCPFTTWTRGLAWAITGFAEELEFLDTINADDFEPYGGKQAITEEFLKAAYATADFYIANTPVDGIPYWDTGAPGLVHMGDYLNDVSNPFNEYEPIDSSAAAIAAQGLIRLGNYLRSKSKEDEAIKYRQAGLTVANYLYDEPYLSTNEMHQGLILHSVYHHPRGWDYIPENAKIPMGESSMWGDYHARELGVMILREANEEGYMTFFG